MNSNNETLYYKSPVILFYVIRVCYTSFDKVLSWQLKCACDTKNLVKISTQDMSRACYVSHGDKWILQILHMKDQHIIYFSKKRAFYKPQWFFFLGPDFYEMKIQRLDCVSIHRQKHSWLRPSWQS
jgi:hypothetical protein